VPAGISRCAVTFLCGHVLKWTDLWFPPTEIASQALGILESLSLTLAVCPRTLLACAGKDSWIPRRDRGAGSAVAFNKEKVMDAARKFVDKGQLDKAVKEYLRIVREDPRDVRVWLKIGDLYAKKGGKQEAVETYLRVAQFYHEQGFFLKAVAVYKQILKLDPRLVDVNLKLAELYRQLGLMSDAMQHYEAVAAHFHREGNTRDAIAAVSKLVDLDPDNIATRIKLAELYSKDGMTQEAATAFAVACDQLRKQGRQDDFIKVAERLLFHHPENHALNRELAALYLHRNDPRRALQKLQASFKADPRDVDTLTLLASAFHALEQKSKTVSVLKELARIHQENKSGDKASEVFRRILEFAPTDPDAISFLGEQAILAPTPKVAQGPSPLRLQLTHELPAIGDPRGATGSMPLLNESEISASDFALPEYDDSDFSQELERSAHDLRSNSAAGEQHAEEIAKTLAESDVYVKYGLHQKAIDHLRRVFSFDPHNVEARERLKEIFIAQGRNAEAESELFALAELVASESPSRAESYLRELLAFNGAHAGALELARRFRLRISRLASEPSTGGSLGYDDFEYGDVALARDPVDDFDPQEIIGAASGSPTPGRPPLPPIGNDDFLESPSQETRQMSQAQALELVERAQDALRDEFGLDDDLAWDSLLGETSDGGANYRPVRPMGRPNDGSLQVAHDSLDGVLDASIMDAQLDDGALSHEIDLEVANELGRYPDEAAVLPEDMPFDPHEARAFDAAVGDSFDPYGEEQETPVESYDAASGISVDTAAVDLLPDLDDPRAVRELEDELEEAEFYSSQKMFAQASEILRSLATRFPHHPLILAKLRDLASPPLEQSGSFEGQEADSMLSLDGALGGTEAIEIDDIEEVSDFDLDSDADPQTNLDDQEEPSIDSPPGRHKRAPSVLLEKPVDDADADTHYDLGLAYKEMGLYHEAIKAFDKARRGSKEVQSRLMIGICHREMGNGTEAVHQFKLGLHAGSISDRERQSLYYEIGATYEGMNDTTEALYYFEMVVKRDPGFADAAVRAEVMRKALRRSG
jgi:pilus assembly protein FimV